MRLALLLWAAVLLAGGSAQVLTPSQVTISHRKPITATATCGEVNGQPITEVYCSLAGSMQYTPWDSYSYSEEHSMRGIQGVQELRNPREAFLQGGHGCGHCRADNENGHPAVNMVDGNASWWQSPPLSRGMQHNNINITIDLEQEFHVAYVWIQMANSPKPGTWVLERSTDYGKTFKPWYYFAENNAECMRRFGIESLSPIMEEDSVICRSDLSSIQPLENAEVVINLLENRPNRKQFATNAKLQEFTRATTVRLRLLGTRTLHGHLISTNDQKNDPTVTRRYFYSIKEIHMGGRCVCNGHASTCDILDTNRPNAMLCRCAHNTCGDMCDRCCPGFEQKLWQPSTATNNFTCEPCNCFGRSEECQYDEELDKESASLDMHGNYAGGGRCLNCRDNTEGVNCNQCVAGYYRPADRQWTDAQPCQKCQCDPTKHIDVCAEETGACQCQERFVGAECDQCAKGYYDAPECKPCECHVDGTEGDVCLPEEGQCPCKPGFGGTFCNQCADGFTNVTAGCVECNCTEHGSMHANCSVETGQCVCKAPFSGVACDECALGYYNYPTCEYCDCDPSGTEDGVCDSSSGQCLCKPGFAGTRCDQCDVEFWGYPACKQCECTGAGITDKQCDLKTGECPCSGNFTGRSCDTCAAGFYDYPECKACACLIEGAKGQTCDDKGQCYCKGNFEGERCDRCKPNFFNFPTCEECNCHPSGVTRDFAGCDKVAPGELCSCRRNVQGRTCDECKPTFWDLQYHHDEGCVSCGCNLAGTLSGLDACDQKNGQCVCKMNVAGKQCERCADGYFNMQSFNQHGCEACNCDVGGSLLGGMCDGESGQCKCRPRVQGQRCDRPIENHYFPTLWHMKYEAEDGRTIDNRPVRFASDGNEFANYSWRGFSVHSPIQEKIILDVDIPKSSVYRLLFHYHNPTQVNIDAVVALAPMQRTSDAEQSEKVNFAPSAEPRTIEATVPGKPLVLNQGKWALTISTPKRLFLDYAVLIPSEYYEGSILQDKSVGPCDALTQHNTTCIDLLYPPLPVSSARIDATGPDPLVELTEDGQEQPIGTYPIELLPAEIGPAAFVRAGNESRVVKLSLPVPEEDDYVILLEYYNREKTDLPVGVEVVQNDDSLLNGKVVIHHCPFAAFCRELVASTGEPALVHLKKGENATILLQVDPMNEFGLAAVNLVPRKEWTTEYLKQVSVCIRRDGVCVPQVFPPAPQSVTTEAEAGANEPNAIRGDKLPFNIAGAEEVTVMPLDDNQATLEVTGVVPARDHYLLLVDYFNPDNTATDVDVIIQNEHNLYEATLPLAYCPSVSGCRALIHHKGKPEHQPFFLEEDKYTAQLFHNATQKGPFYINSVTIVPFRQFSKQLMNPQALDLSTNFVEQCSPDFFKNAPETSTQYCREKIFSLTTHFNGAASACECSVPGSLSFCCAEYGGQCECKANIIGRKCDRCAPGYYNYPECVKCKCGDGQQCDEQTGQCFCPPHVEGQTCDKCVSYAYGYDPLIGCQQCGCHPQGSDGGQMLCDAMSGQCLCREAVGGRQCDRCLPGSYGFPACHACRCNADGTTEDVCDPTNAACKCKENVEGADCSRCRPGTFDLAPENPQGCTDCFCFGVTSQCRSSFFPVSIMAIDYSNFTMTDEDGDLTSDGDKVEYTAGDNSTDRNVFLVVPIEHGKDYTSSYGLGLSFALSVQPKSDSNALSSSPDVRLTGANMTAEFWANEQPSNPKEKFTIRCTIVPENFILTSGKPVSREDMMMILHSLEKVELKLSHYEQPAAGVLHSFAMEVSSPDAGFESDRRASSVEMCHCPAPYTGPSCQECAAGYYRVDSGSLLGACVPCECNGHSGSCDADTGVCYDCQDNTHGEHCELCNEGHYGDATVGSPYDCMACMCPFAPTNNFASSCQVSDEGNLLSCACKEGYTGDRCDRCATGFYGNPLEAGGECRPCDCNGNNNLTDSRACHPVTGDCYMCENNTAGRHCEWCDSWFHGDALVAKDCAECSCDQCGAQTCDNQLGHCQCKPNVEGYDCDRCKADHWGFSRCAGCSPCHCAVASSSSQCHGETGQCACRPGAAGLRCEHCQHGFWNYGEHGCQKCDCEADLSVGTVCNVHTGQCQCQEGATGPRCDQCVPHYLRIPEFGCRRCDQCVHNLNADVDVLDAQITRLGAAIGNISSATVVGARLSKSSKMLGNFTEITDMLDRYDDETSLFGKSRGELNNAVSVLNGANSTLEQALNNAARVNNLTNNGEQLRMDIRDSAETAQWVVQSIRNIASSVGSEGTALEDQERLIQEAQKIAMALTEKKEQDPKASEIPDKVAAAAKKVAEQTDKNGELQKKIDSGKEKADEIDKFVRESESELAKTAQMAKHTLENVKKIQVFTVDALASGLVSDESMLREQIKEVDETNQQAANLTETFKENLEGIQNALLTLNETMSELSDKEEAAREKRQVTQLLDDLLPKEVVSKADELQQTAASLNGTFGSARAESQNAVAAANAYDEVSDTLKKAADAAQTAQTLLAEEEESVQEMKDRVNDASAESGVLVRKAADLHHDMVNELEKQVEDEKITIDGIRDSVAAMQSAREGLKSADKTNSTQLSELDSKMEAIEQRNKDSLAALEKAKQDAKKLEKDADKVAKKATDAVQGAKMIRQNVDALAKVAPQVVDAFEKYKEAVAGKTASVDSLADRLEQLKEKVAVARDAANRIKLGAHFEGGSSIDVNMPARVSRSAAYTHLAFHMKTDKEHGIPLFFGNEEGAAGTRAVPTDDYIAVEVEYGKPKVSVNLGAGPLVVGLDSKVNDNEWRKLEVERIGKTATVRLYHPNSEQVLEEKTGTAAGNKSVLNLHQTLSKLFVGGVPRTAKIASEVRNRDFVGDIEGVQLHGEPVGLWNAREGGMIHVTGTKRPINLDSAQDTGVSLAGDGYLIYNLGYWNPRKKTVFALSFLTYSPDGMLFYVGKEKDFMSLSLESGAVKLSVDFGSGVGSFPSDATAYNDGQWHSVAVFRDEKHVKVEVDGQTVTEGDAPGDTAELSVGDHFYLGGVPSGVVTRSPVEAWRGCINTVQLDKDMVNLHAAYKSKGVRNACASSSVREVSILSDRSSATFDNVTVNDDIEVTLKFKTRQPDGTLFLIQTEEQEPVLKVSLAGGVITAAASENDQVELELTTAADGQWHYLTVKKSTAGLRIDADDLFSKQLDKQIGNEFNTTIGEVVIAPEDKGEISFGKGGRYIGCIGDVTFNGKLLDFAKAATKEVQLTGCALPADEIIPVEGDEQITTTAAAPELVEIEENSPVKPLPTEEETTTTEEPTEKTKAQVRPEGSCTLLTTSQGSDGDDDGTRFGLQPASRVEFHAMPEAFDKSGMFAMQVRATASNGVIMFATNEKHTDHIGLFLVDGRVLFSFNTGSGATTINSTRSILDGEWHQIKASRKGNKGVLIVDEESQEGTSGHETETVDTQAPLYFGGIPADVTKAARLVVPGIKSEFSGCIREMKLNDKKFGGETKEIGTVPCSTYVENGIFFGADGGYAIINKEYQVGSAFSAELDIRPRSQNGVLISVGVLEYLTVEMINGDIHFTVDSGAGAESVIYAPTAKNAICDGHWHSIKIYKKNKLLTLSVDGKSNLLIMKKSKKSNTNTKDPIYLGGVPDGQKNAGVKSTEPYVGCVRIQSFGQKKSGKERKKKNIDVASLDVFGDVNKHECPVN